MTRLPLQPETLLAHGEFLHELARRLLRDEHGAEDVVQQTWVQALTTPRPLAGGSTGARAWLARVVRNLSHNVHRTDARRATRERAAAAPAAVPSTEEIVEREAVRQQVVQAVLGLDERYRTVIVLRYFEHLEPQAIATRLDVSPSTVRTRLQRAHEALRRALDRAHGGRGAWTALLAPFVPVPPAATATTAAAVPPTTWSVLLMKKTLLVAGGLLVALATTTWLAFGRGGDLRPIEPGTADPGSSILAPAPLAIDDAGHGSRREAATTDTVLPGTDDRADRRSGPRFVAALGGFRGRIVDARSGSPIADCDVELLRVALDSLFERVLADGRPAAPGRQQPHLRAGATRSGEDGRFELTGVRPRGLFLLNARSPSTTASTTRVVEATPRPGEIVDLGDVVLVPNARLTGTVVDADGAPVAGAAVLAIDLPGAFLAIAPLHRLEPGCALLFAPDRLPTRVLELPSWVDDVVAALPLPRTTTRADGTFELVGVPPGRTALGVVAHDRPPLLRDGVRVPDAMNAEESVHDVGTLDLPRGEDVFGRVVDAAGEPVANAQVRVAPTGLLQPFDIASRMLHTGSDGTFTVGGFPRGRVRVAARRHDGDPWVVSDAVPADDATVALPSAHTLTLRLASRTRPGETFDDATVELFAGRGDGLADLAGLGLAAPVDTSIRATRDGTRLVIRALPVGDYVAIVRAAAHAAAVVDVALTEDRAVDVELGPRRELVVEVLDPNGAPIADAAVFARGRGDGPWQRTLPVHQGTTDGAGRCTIDADGGSAGGAQVIASHPEFGRTMGLATIDRTPSIVTLRFAPSGRVQGTVTEDGRAVAFGQWAVLLQNDAPGASPAIASIGQPDDRGTFRFDGLQPGRYRAMAVPSFGAQVTLGTAYGLQKYSWLPRRSTAAFDVTADETTELRLDVGAGDGDESAAEPSGRLRGTLRVDGEPAAGYVVICEVGRDQEPRNAVVAADGSFDFGPVPAGPRYVFAFELESRDPLDNWPHHMWAENVTVVRDRDHELHGDVRTGTLRGRVVDADGAAVGGAVVIARGTLAAPSRPSGQPTTTRFVVRSDDDGRFELAGLAAGTWSLRSRPGPESRDPSPAEAVLDDVELSAGQDRSDLRLELTR